MEEKEEFVIKKSKKGIFGIIFLIVVLCGIGFGAYYFIQENHPKKALYKSFVGLEKDVEGMMSLNVKTDEVKKINLDSKLAVEITAPKDESSQFYSIINKINLESYLGYDLDKKTLYADLNATYDNDLVGKVTLLNKDKDVYVSLNELYDKVIKLSEDDMSAEEFTLDFDSENYKKYAEYQKEALVKAYDKIDLDSSYVKLNERRVRKIVIKNANEVMIEYYNVLLQNNDYLTIASKIENVDKEDLISNLEYSRDELKDAREGIINVYMSMLKSKFIKLEVIDEDEKVTIENDKNVISLKAYDNDIISSIIDLKLDKDVIVINFSDVESSLDIKLTINYKVDFSSEIKSLDTSNSVLYSKMSDKDKYSIMEKFMKQKGATSLIQDLSGDTGSVA